MARGILTNNSALFLDFDGTLAPIQDDPDTVALPEGGERVLAGLADALGGALALVSGRDARDLSTRVPTSLWRAGNHGDIILPPGATEPASLQEPPSTLLQAAAALVGAHEGVRLEKKARVLTIHTRHRRDLEDLIAAACEEFARDVGGYKVQRGKDVTELKPADVNKGVAIGKILGMEPFQGRVPIFVGDDTTDEDGFIVCIHRGGSAIKVGGGKTLAPHRLANPAAVWKFLEEALHDLA